METLTVPATINYPQEYSLRRCTACRQYHGSTLCNLSMIRHILRNQ